MHKFNYYLLAILLASFFSCQQSGSQLGKTAVSEGGNASTSDSLQKAASRTDYSFDQQLVLSTLEELSKDSYQGRKTGTEGHLAAKKFILKKFQYLGLQGLNGSYEQPFSALLRGESDSVGASNLVGYIKGSYHPEKYIVVGAHYDHVGVRNGEVYNGADDNASGVGGLLGIANYFTQNPPEHSILLLAFDAEESGLQGAKFFVNNPLISLDKVAMMINMDMISRSDKKEIYASGAYHYPYLQEFLDEIRSSSTTVKLKTGHDKPSLGRDDWTNSSDHGPFHKANIPFIYFGVEDHKDYHKPTDDFNKIDQNFYLDCVELIIESVDTFDKALGKIESRGQSPVEGEE